jgi:hypothetical protein
MKLTRCKKTTFAGARSSIVATQAEVHEPTKRMRMRVMNSILILTIVGLLIAPLAKAQAAGAQSLRLDRQRNSKMHARACASSLKLET